MGDNYGLTWHKLANWMKEGFVLDNTGPLWLRWDGIHCGDEKTLRLINNAPGLLVAVKEFLTLTKNVPFKIYEADLLDLKEAVIKVEGKTP